MISSLKSREKIELLFEKGTLIKEDGLFLKIYNFNNFSFGSTRNSQNYKRVNLIHKANEVYLIEFVANKERSSSRSENYLEKNYILEKEQLNPTLTYLAGKNNRIN